MHSIKTTHNNSISERVCETYNKSNIEEMERQYPQYKPQKHWRKEKRPRKHNHDYNYMIIMIITMTMTEIVGPETGIDHIVEIDHETT